MRCRSIWAGAFTAMAYQLLGDLRPGSVSTGRPPRALLGCQIGSHGMSAEYIEDREGPRDECGVFGICAPGREAARLTYFALYALQHRGQESAGIATAQRGHIMAMRDQGLVNQVFDEQKLRALQGDMAVGHVRYSTTGASSWENSQPVWRADRRELALGHNGNLINAVALHGSLRSAGVSFRSTSDSEIIAALLSTHPARSEERRVGKE